MSVVLLACSKKSDTVAMQPQITTECPNHQRIVLTLKACSQGYITKSDQMRKELKIRVVLYFGGTVPPLEANVTLNKNLEAQVEIPKDYPTSWIYIKGSNTLGVWSSKAVNLNRSITYDFTKISNVYRDEDAPEPEVKINKVWCMYSGEVNNDIVIDIMDYYQIYSLNGKRGNHNEDINGDGVVNSLDWQMAYNNTLLGVYEQSPFSDK